MPMYTHKCDTCARLVAVRCPIDQRDAPKACREVALEAPAAVTPPPAFGRREAAPEAFPDCAGTLTRPAGDLDTTAFTPYGWKP